jgi:tetratricopeptide (TPR) repeat protein
VSRERTFLIIALLAIGTGGSAQQSQLGRVEFQVTGLEKSREYFLRGLAALHSFWYEEALEAFRESTRVAPDFSMGYWGEAMAHNHPLWGEQDTEDARKVLQKLNVAPKLTPRERAYLNAVRILYGEGDKHARDLAYSAAMEKIYRDYPDDLDAACFYALSLLGTVRPEDKGFRRQAQAGATALAVFEKNPNHPGAAHYIIHAFDDPDHAILALPAARRYAEIAPEAHHARHMPAHIFLQLGMWPEAAASNESAWEASDAWVTRKNLSPVNRDYHSLYWLLYVYLQQGRYGKAEQSLELMKKVMTESKDDKRPGYFASNYAMMAAAFMVETERWDLAAKLFGAARADEQPAGEHSGHAAHSEAGAQGRTAARSNTSQVVPVFMLGLAAAKKKSDESEKNLAALRALQKAEKNSYRAKSEEIRELEIAAVAASSKGQHSKAIELMKEARKLEDDLAPPSGPPALIKPAHELFGEVLLGAGKASEAAEQFAAALLRQPNRARSLIGAARAAAQSGNAKAAAEFYGKFLKQWEQADQDLPELTEAKEYLSRHPTP